MSGSSKALEWLNSAVSEKLINSFDYKEFKYNEKINESRTSSIFRSEWTNCGLTVALKSLKFDTEGMDMNTFVKEHSQMNPCGKEWLTNYWKHAYLKE
ncbi:41047_t:CDS:2 [Gigaspora margarita]|uniref:41047_t:CDS:1 n=1 Tax=Gigaspora margarita TaxID=4874 RepID=A0ABN7UUW2_GIGMA|nr:41047_t:CDS:2 [Gigaspora margarita]